MTITGKYRQVGILRRSVIITVAIYNVEVTVLTYFDHVSIFNLLFNAPIVDFDACLTSL